MVISEAIFGTLSYRIMGSHVGLKPHPSNFELQKLYFCKVKLWSMKFFLYLGFQM